jgi:general secretion pathway protein C
MGLNEIAARMAEPARWIIIGGIAFTLANLVLFFIAPPAGDTASAGSATSSSTQRVPDRRPAVSLNAILSRNLFGEAGATSAPVDTGLPAVETRLPLELLGVFVADVLAESAAIVSQKGKAGELYAIGGMLPGNAELIEVHSDHIVLRRAGGRETLRFPEISSAPMVSVPELSPARSQPSAAATNSAPWTEEVPSPRDFVSAYRGRLDEDPEGALQELGITPVDDADGSGYRLDDMAANSPYLSQTGLQPGDVVLSVNGQPVGNIQQDRRQIDNILAQGSARIEVQRGTRRFFVTASLK